MTTAYFAELTDHTIEEAETLLKWAKVVTSAYSTPVSYVWDYGDACHLWFWLSDQSILAIEAGSEAIK